MVHDAADPARLLRSIRESLNPGGRYVCLDINASQGLEENVGTLGTVFYGFSLLYCMTSSLAAGGVGLGTCAFTEPVARAMCAEARFNEVRRVPLDNPFNILYEITRARPAACLQGPGRGASVRSFGASRTIRLGFGGSTMATTRELFDQATAAFNSHDRERIAALTADDCVSISPGGMRAEGKDAVMEFNMSWIEAFPDVHIDVQNTFIDGDVAIEESVIHGTHNGVFHTPMGDVPPTGKTVTGEYTGIFEFRDGKVVSQRFMFDRLNLLEQLGLLPEMAGTAGA